MATSAGEVEVKLTLKQADFKRLLSQSQDDLQGFAGKTQGFVSQHAIAMAAALTSIIAFAKSSIEAYSQQEIATTKLVHALENQNRASAETVGHLQTMATRLSNLTGIQDEVINGAQAMLVTFGLQGEALDKATKAALDMSAAMGIDLQQAVMLLGKSFQGHTTMLQRYGIEINKNIDPSKKFAAVLQEVNSRFGGSAAAQAQTFTGQMKLLGVAFNELEEAIGGLLAKSGGGLVGWLTDMVRGLTFIVQGLGSMKSAIITVGSLIQTYFIFLWGSLVNIIITFIQKIFELESHIPIIGSLFTMLAEKTGQAKDALNEQVLKFMALKAVSIESAGKVVEDEKKKQLEFHNTAKEMQTVTTQSSLFVKDKMAEETKLRNEYYANLKKAQQNFTDGFITTEADMWDFVSSQRDSFFQGFGDAIGRMVIEGKNFAESMKAVFKEMAVAFISYVAQMIAKWLAFMALKAAFGGATGGMGFAAAFAEGGVIAEPSIITGLNSGRQILAGEAGPEAVVPMGKNMTKGELGGDGGGGQVTINISGTFLEADQNTWQRLMREKVIPEIRRFTMSSPTGPFNRRRGVV